MKIFFLLEITRGHGSCECVVEDWVTQYAGEIPLLPMTKKDQISCDGQDHAVAGRGYLGDKGSDFVETFYQAILVVRFPGIPPGIDLQLVEEIGVVTDAEIGRVEIVECAADLSYFFRAKCAGRAEAGFARGVLWLEQEVQRVGGTLLLFLPCEQIMHRYKSAFQIILLTIDDLGRPFSERFQDFFVLIFVHGFVYFAVDQDVEEEGLLEDIANFSNSYGSDGQVCAHRAFSYKRLGVGVIAKGLLPGKKWRF